MKDQDNIWSGFHGSLARGKRPALLVVDFQLGFTDPSVGPLASDCTTAIEATDRLIQAMHGIGPVIFTICGYDPNQGDAGCWIQKCPTLSTLVRGTPACELDPRITFDPESHLVLHKTQASAFFGTPLTGILAANRCDMLVVCGCTTSGCVRASVVDAMQYGFPPFVVTDCVADRSKAQHESNLIDMDSKYADVVGIEEMVATLAQIDSSPATER